MILRRDKIGDDNSDNAAIKKLKNFSTNIDSMNITLNKEILEDLITRKCEKTIVDNGQKELMNSQVKLAGSEFIACFRGLSNTTKHSNYSKFYAKIEDNLEKFIRNQDKLDPKYVKNTEEQKIKLLNEYKKTREILADFDIRGEIYEAYQAKQRKQYLITEEIGRLNIEKVKAQQKRKTMIEEMETKAGINVCQAYKVRQMMTKLTTDKKSKIAGSSYNKMDIIKKFRAGAMISYVNAQVIAEKSDEDTKFKLAWADRLTEQEKIETQKENLITEHNSQIKMIKTQKKKYKLRLKKLYINLLNEPQISYEKGVN